MRIKCHDAQRPSTQCAALAKLYLIMLNVVRTTLLIAKGGKLQRRTIRLGFQDAQKEGLRAVSSHCPGSCLCQLLGGGLCLFSVQLISCNNLMYDWHRGSCYGLYLHSSLPQFVYFLYAYLFILYLLFPAWDALLSPPSRACHSLRPAMVSLPPRGPL